MPKNDYYYALGRRKTATARIHLKGGKGSVVINDKSAAEYFANSKYALTKLRQPFAVLDLDGNKYDISVHVNGGGQDGQVEAIRLAIAKALSVMNEDYKSTLKRADLLTRDPRDKERKKFGLLGARKKRQFTKR